MDRRTDIKRAALSLIPWPEADSPHAWFSPVTKQISANSDGAFAHETFHKVYDASPVRRSTLHSKAVEEMWCELFRFVFTHWSTWHGRLCSTPYGTPQRMAKAVIDRWYISYDDFEKPFRALWHDWCEKAAQRPDNADVLVPRDGGSE